MDSLRTALQTLLVELFPTAGDFESFCIGQFLSIYRLASSGMNRLDQINLLFGQAAPHQIVHALFVHFHGDRKTLRLIEARIAALDSEDARAEFDVNQSILELTQELAERRSRGVPADVIAGRLKELKKRRRELREGPGLRAGDELGGRYKLLTVIGEGGFATVWQAFDVQGQLVVAIKVLHGEKAASVRSRERFDRGARILRSLNHPHIVRLLEEPKVDRNYHYVVLEYAAGGDLDKAVLRSAQPKDVLWRAVLQTADALIHAHAAGLTHRDVKPENILLTVAGVAKLTDFDLVRDEASDGGTRTGGMGTLLYAAYEQRRDGSRVDVRADIYSLGMTAVFVLHGKRLPAEVFENEGRQAFIAKLDCPKALRDVLRKAVDADRSKRYQRMTELRADLERTSTPWLLAKSSQPPVTTPAAPPRKTSPATRSGLAAVAGFGFGLVGLGVYLYTLPAPRDLSAPVLVAQSPDAGLGPPDASLARVSPTGGFTLRSDPPGAAETVAIAPATKPVGEPRSRLGNAGLTIPAAMTEKKGRSKKDQAWVDPFQPTVDERPNTDSSGSGDKPNVSEKKPDDIMDEAKKAYITGDKERAVELALQAAEKPGPHVVNSWRFVGAAACSMHNVQSANKAYAHLQSEDHKQLLAELCQRNGLALLNGQFILTE